MSKDIYFDLVGGASGDMLLSSLLGLGLDFNYLKDNFKKLNVKFNVNKKKTKFNHAAVDRLYFSSPSKINLSYREITKLIKESKLDSGVKEKSLVSFKHIFGVEKRIHQSSKRDFRFEHLGEIDAIAEIVGFFLGMKYLDINNVYISSISVSRPAPATLELLKGKEIKIVDFGYESVTPTAALLLKDSYSISIPFSFTKYSYACGNYGDSDYLVAYLFSCDDFDRDKVVKIEATIDDMNPQVFSILFDSLYKRGAKEVYIEQVITKKSRPAFVLNVLSDEKSLIFLREAIFKFTSTFGFRYQFFYRDKLKYTFIYKNTKWGRIKFRVSRSGGFKKEIPEYEDCRRAAEKSNIPFIDLYNKLI